MFQNLDSLQISKRTQHTMTIIDNYVIIFGGRQDTKEFLLENSTDAIVFDTLNNSLEVVPLTGTPLTRRFAHSACLYGKDKIVLYGGHYMDLLDDVVTLTFNETNKKKSLEVTVLGRCSGSKPRYQHTAHIHNNIMYVIGGAVSTNKAAPFLTQLNMGYLSLLVDFLYSLC